MMAAIALREVDEQPFDFGKQAGAMERDTGLIADCGQQLELGFGEGAGVLTVDVEHAQYFVGRAHRRAHHGSNAVANDALAAAVATIGKRVVTEGREAVLEDVVDHGARDGHVLRTAARGARGHRLDVGPRAGTDENGRALAAGGVENSRQNRVEQRLGGGRTREPRGDVMQHRDIALGLRERRLIVAAAPTLEKRRPRGIDRSPDQRLARLVGADPE